MHIVRKAIAFAARRHEGQYRKDRETPYVSHPFRVMLNVLHEFGCTDPDTLAAAVLHDTIEDTRTDHDDILRAFNPTVAGYVTLLTKDKRLAEDEREDRYFEGIRTAPLPVKLCKVADTLDNLRDLGPGVGDKKKTLAKAERLFEIFPSPEPALARALVILKREMAAVTQA